MKLYRFARELTLVVLFFVHGYSHAYNAYVTNYDSDSVSVVSLPSGTVIATLATQEGPYSIVSTSSLNQIYLSNYTSETISVINAASNTVTATIPVETDPYFFVITPNGAQGYVVNDDSGTVTVFATATNTVTTTISVGEDPYGIVVTPDGSKVYVGNYDSDSVSVIDTATNTVIATISVGSGPYLPAIRPDGAFVYFPNYSDGTVSVISTATDMVVATLSIAESEILEQAFASPDGTKVYIATSSGDLLYVIDAINNTSAGTITTQAYPSYVAFTADSSTAYVSNYNSSTISVINVASGMVVGTLNVSEHPYALAITPDGTLLLAVHYTSPGFLDLIALPGNTLLTSVMLQNESSYIAFGITVEPPTNLSGSQHKNRFLTQTDLINVLRWNPPDTGLTPVYYNVYRGDLNTLVGVVPANVPLTYSDHNRMKNIPYVYYIISVDSQGNLSSPASITVLPSR